MKIELEIKNDENIKSMTAGQQEQIAEIFNALVVSGGLTGVKGGQTIVHFDGEGIFQGVELKYWPWRRRKN
ncbi:MAG: hypothetical protein AAB706_02165 [Patescibacteria group bacterium]